MLRYETDIAVHSMKDVPVQFPPSLTLSVVTEREDPRDALIARNGLKLDTLPKGSRVGTGSFRRTTQLLNYRPDLEVVPMRGNVQTRLDKLESEGLDAIILAAAGLIRLDMADHITEYIEPEIMLPGGGQGAVGIESRKEDLRVMNRIFPLDHEETHLALEAERAFLTRLEGGCQVPIGVYATIEGETLHLRGLVGSLDGKQMLKAERKGSVEDPEAIGFELAGEILGMGADKILKEVYGT
jgi:hydroxymethylbilane synthase